MAELFISKRVIFPRGKQRKFILQAKKTLGLSYLELAILLKISNRTLTDWKREKFSMNLRAVKILLKKTNRKIPKNIKIKEPFWYVNKGANLGGIAVYKKYGRIGGDPEYRKKKWYEWWKNKGKHRKHPIIAVTKPIKKPHFSKELAEFVGIVMGDGGITNRQITITLHDKDDKAYSQFVVPLIKRLFNVPIGIYHRKEESVMNFIISRTVYVAPEPDKSGLGQG